MTDHRTTKKLTTTFYIGALNDDRFWIQCPDGRMFQLSESSLRVLQRLADNEPVESIANDLGVDRTDISTLMDALHMKPNSPFTIQYDQHMHDQSESSNTTNVPFFCPWIDRPWFAQLVIATVVLSAVLLAMFIQHAPVVIIRGFAEQWLIAGLLTLSVLIHETGHLCAMPRHRNISVFVQWAGPLPMLSIICNEAWKLPKWQRLRINFGGLVADLVISGVAASIGFLAEPLSPWVWTFLIVHLIRMVFAIFPLLPGDGYWVLVDWFDHPNLWAKALDDLKQCRLTWRSVYAVSRILFLLIIWCIYFSIVVRLAATFLALPWHQSWHVLYYPAPLLITLTVLGQLIFACSTVYKMLFSRNLRPGRGENR